MIYKGLDDDEAVFLQFVADKRAKLDAETRDEENQELVAYRVGERSTVLKQQSQFFPSLPCLFTPSYCDHLTLFPSLLL